MHTSAPWRNGPDVHAPPPSSKKMWEEEGGGTSAPGRLRRGAEVYRYPLGGLYGPTHRAKSHL